MIAQGNDLAVAVEVFSRLCADVLECSLRRHAVHNAAFLRLCDLYRINLNGALDGGVLDLGVVCRVVVLGGPLRPEVDRYLYPVAVASPARGCPGREGDGVLFACLKIDDALKVAFVVVDARTGDYAHGVAGVNITAEVGDHRTGRDWIGGDLAQRFKDAGACQIASTRFGTASAAGVPVVVDLVVAVALVSPGDVYVAVGVGGEVGVTGNNAIIRGQLLGSTPRAARRSSGIVYLVVRTGAVFPSYPNRAEGIAADGEVVKRCGTVTYLNRGVPGTAHVVYHRHLVGRGIVHVGDV